MALRLNYQIICNNQEWRKLLFSISDRKKKIGATRHALGSFDNHCMYTCLCCESHITILLPSRAWVQPFPLCYPWAPKIHHSSDSPSHPFAIASLSNSDRCKKIFSPRAFPLSILSKCSQCVTQLFPEDTFYHLDLLKKKKKKFPKVFNLLLR